MTDYLLDTNILLLWLADDPKLPKKAHKLIENHKNTFFVSSVSAWEIAIKKSIGKLKISGDINKAIKTSGFLHLNITMKHAFSVASLPNIHKDPFDRMLVSQAEIENLVLLTKDKIFKKYKVQASIA